MKSRLLRVLGSLILFAAALMTSPVSPARAATHTVTNTNDSGPGSLREAVGLAGDGDTILFDGVSGTILLGSPIEIYNSITITGPGSSWLSVSGGDLVRVLRVSGENVTISGLTITHGYVEGDYGGGILHWQGTLTLENVDVLLNQALKSTISPVGFGGGIANYSGTLVMTNSRLASNTAERMGGGLYSYFGAGLSMTNVLVEYNQALADSGGGLAIRGASTGQTPLPVTLDQVSIKNNIASYSSGGLYSDDSLTISNSLIAGNTSSGSGGAGGMMFNDSSTGALPITVGLTNVTIAENTSASPGGGVRFNLVQAASSATLNNVTIANNSQTLGNGYGAGIYQSGPAPVNLGNSVLAGNLYGSTPDDCAGTLVSLDYNLVQDTSHCTITGAAGHNLTGVSAGLAGLALNGGPTLSMALLPTSPALDAGNDLTCAPTDQRGVARPQGAHCDMGAYELALYRLSVVKSGMGAGLVSSDPPGIDCGLTCGYDFPEQTPVTLSAVASAGSAFDGWSGGGCSGPGTCTLNMDAVKSVIASFSLVPIRDYLPLIVR